MKKMLLFIYCTFIFLVPQSQSSFSATPAASHIPIENLSVTDWQVDLRFLQVTIHRDYSFLFKKISADAFDAEVKKLNKAMHSLTVDERILGFHKIMSLFKYGHTRMAEERSSFKLHMAPVNFYWFSDGIYVEAADINNSSIVGAKLIKVEGIPVIQALEAVKPVNSVENEQKFRQEGVKYLTILEILHAQGITKELQTAISYTLEKDGKTFEQKITVIDASQMPENYDFIKPNGNWVSARDQNSTPYYLKYKNKNYYSEYIPETKKIYVRYSEVNNDPNETIEAFFKKVFEFVDKNEVEKFILDVRLNGGGNGILNKPIVTGLIESKKINKPGKLFVIIGRATYSACQLLVNDLSNFTNAIFVGEPTSEKVNFYGDFRTVLLPNSKIPVRLSYGWWQGGKPQQYRDADWLAPQLAVDMSFDDYRSNRDPMLETCLEASSDKTLIIDPLQYLTELFMEGKMSEVPNEAKKMIADPMYRYVNFEGGINTAGYTMLNQKQLDAALFIFQLNTELFPGSANTWDSYAEANWKANKIDKAIEYYNKAIELDPNGVTGEGARNMLKKILAEKGN